MPAPNFPRREAGIAAAATELAACASLEITAGRLDEVRAIAELLPRGTRVFVNHLPRNALADCMAMWDRGTHMSRDDWRRTCSKTLSGTEPGYTKTKRRR